MRLALRPSFDKRRHQLSAEVAAITGDTRSQPIPLRRRQQIDFPQPALRAIGQRLSESANGLVHVVADIPAVQSIAHQRDYLKTAGLKTIDLKTTGLKTAGLKTAAGIVDGDGDRVVILRSAGHQRHTIGGSQ